MTDRPLDAPKASAGLVRFDAAGLYSMVERYAGFGDHRSGTEADHRSTNWLMSLLESMGAEVERSGYRFDRYVASVQLTAGGDPVPAEPLFYSACGHWDTEDLAVIELDAEVAARADRIDTAIGAELASVGDRGPATPIVVATPGPPGVVVQINRKPQLSLDRPVVIIPAERADQVRAGARLTMTATLEPDTTGTNVVARIGPAGAPPIVVTTPLTGWTPCAGERGTGLAVALAMTADLARDHRVEFVGCGGHELDFAGLRQHIVDRNSAGREVTGLAVIHLGASVGAVDIIAEGTRKLGRRRMVVTSAPDRAGIAERAAAGNWRLVDLGPGDFWPGEGGTWNAAGATVLSFVGKFDLFHTAADLPAAATTPTAMATASAVAIETARHFLQSQREARTEQGLEPEPEPEPAETT